MLCYLLVLHFSCSRVLNDRVWMDYGCCGGCGVVVLWCEADELAALFDDTDFVEGSRAEEVI